MSDHHDLNAGIYTTVQQPGTLSVWAAVLVDGRSAEPLTP